MVDPNILTGGGAEYPSKMKMSGSAPQKGGRKKSRRTGVQVLGGGGSEYPSTMKMSGVAPIKGGRKKSQRTRVQPCTHPSWTENILENEERGETTDTYKKR